MVKPFLHIGVVAFIGIIIITSCKKELSCENCKDGNKPPIAAAGPDQTLTLPTDSALLDGSKSSDPDGKISVWEWTKIAGPALFSIDNTSSEKTLVRNLNAGAYQFELKVTDDKNDFVSDYCYRHTFTCFA